MRLDSSNLKNNKDFHRDIFEAVKSQHFLHDVPHPGGMCRKSIIACLDSEWFKDTKDTEGARLKVLERALSEMSIVYDEEPFEIFEGKPVRYKVSDAFEFPTESVDSPTALALMMAKDLLSHSLPAVCNQQLDHHVGNIEQYLKRNNKTEYLNWRQKVAWFPEGYSNHMGDMNGISQVVFDRVSEALFTDKKIKATYTPRYGMQGKESEFNPLGLVNRGSIIYLVATYWGYDDIKHLPLYRFGRVTVLDKSAHKPEGFDFQSYIKDGGMLKQALGEAPEQITLQVSSYLLEHFQERQPGISGTFQCDEDQGTATFKEAITNEFLWWLRAMGPNVKVLEPQSLVEYLKDDLQKALSQY